MLNLTAGQIAGLITEYIYAQPAKVTKTFFVLGPVREYILRTLDDTQTQWLSTKITQDHDSLRAFLYSTEGKEAVRHLFNAYQKHTLLKATPQQTNTPPEEENK